MNQIEFGDCKKIMRRWVSEGVKVQMCVTSPPYFGFRDYGTGKWEGGDENCDHSTPRSRGDDIKEGDKQGTSAGSRPNTQWECPCGAVRIDSQVGLESTPEEYVEGMVEIFRLVRDLLADDGVLWLNLGDSYTGSGKGGNPKAGTKQGTNHGSQSVGVLYGKTGDTARQAAVTNVTRKHFDLGPKQLLGIPWRVAFALQADGWYLRQDIIWAKTNPMPESVQDRCTRSHEYIFLFSKRPKYYFSSEAMQEPAIGWNGSTFDGERDLIVRPNTGRKPRVRADRFGGNKHNGDTTKHSDGSIYETKETRNKRDVWFLSTKPFKGAHFATFPPKLIEPCILAGSRLGDAVLDPFMGSGTTAQVALENGRQYLGCELNEKYKELSDARIASVVQKPNDKDWIDELEEAE